jgi:hypothetical protein
VRSKIYWKTAFSLPSENGPWRMNESESLSSQPVAPAKRVQAK